MATESLLSYMPSRLTCLGAFAPYLPWYLRALNTCLVSLISTPLNMIKSLTKAILKCSKRGHSKSTFAQESRIFTPPPPPHLPPCSSLFVFEHPTPRKVRSFWLELTLFPIKCPLYGDVRFIESPSKNQKSSKVNMKSTVCHNFPSTDLLEGPKDSKIKENAKFFHSKVFKQGSLH